MNGDKSIICSAGEDYQILSSRLWWFSYCACRNFKRLRFFLSLSHPLLPLFHRLMGSLIILAKFHLISDKMHFLQKHALIYVGRSSVMKNSDFNSLVKSASTLNWCWLRSIAINVNTQVIYFPVVINHVNDVGNLDWLMVDNRKYPLPFISVYQRLVSGRKWSRRHFSS